jgi:hypothetical protein
VLFIYQNCDAHKNLESPRHDVPVHDMSVVLVATHQHVMNDKGTNVMILSGTMSTRRRLVNATLSSRHTFLVRDVTCYHDTMYLVLKRHNHDIYMPSYAPPDHRR